MGTASRLLSALLGAFRPSTPPTREPAPSARPGGIRNRDATGGTLEIAPPGPRGLTLTYAPERDGAPDGGEIVWTWVPYEERDGRGKDRPVLVLGRRDAAHSFAVRLTSKPHAGDADYLALGAGAWDPQGRPSWVDVEQVYVVPDAAMRREAAALDRQRFDRIAAALSARYGWRRA
ncbi:type II toxin-antitoxin system PemK/MazF family toxin [Microbacterium sp. LMI1-1-1.1]|uniref:type II toxin-antitoxin system PemK/MazF family toxin n=1 Tax=unclassified Microbacterium TaxID=2609290 RepID=UPI0034679C4B